MNPDTILINNSIKLLSDYLDLNDKVGVVGGNLYDENLQPAHSFHRLYPSVFLEFSTVCFHVFEFLRFGKNQRHINLMSLRIVRRLLGETFGETLFSQIEINIRLVR